MFVPDQKGCDMEDVRKKVKELAESYGWFPESRWEDGAVKVLYLHTGPNDQFVQRFNVDNIKYSAWTGYRFTAWDKMEALCKKYSRILRKPVVLVTGILRFCSEFDSESGVTTAEATYGRMIANGFYYDAGKKFQTYCLPFQEDTEWKWHGKTFDENLADELAGDEITEIEFDEITYQLQLEYLRIKLKSSQDIAESCLDNATSIADILRAKADAAELFALQRYEELSAEVRALTELLDKA